MSSGIELKEITDMMLEISKRIDNATREIFKLAKNKATTEHIYREALSKEIVKLRADGVQATLIPDLARGNTAFLKFERDLARDIYNSAKASLEALQVEVSVLQSIVKYQEVI